MSASAAVQVSRFIACKQRILLE